MRGGSSPSGRVELRDSSAGRRTRARSGRPRSGTRSTRGSEKYVGGHGRLDALAKRLQRRPWRDRRARPDSASSPTRHDDRLRAVGAQVRRSPRVEFEVEALEGAGLGVEHGEGREARRESYAHRIRPSARNANELVPNDQAGYPNSASVSMERRALAVADALEVPPAAAVAREHEIARRAPLRLPDRLDAVATGDVLDARDRAVLARARRRGARSRPTASTADPRRGSRAATRRARCAGSSRSRDRRRSRAARRIRPSAATTSSFTTSFELSLSACRSRTPIQSAPSDVTRPSA